MDNLQLKWEEKYAAAIENTLKYREEQEAKGVDGKFSLLIEVSAQHPLLDGTTPSIEYQNRLNKAVELFCKYSGTKDKIRIYIPGSLHKGDKITLSEAGEKWVLDHLLAEDKIEPFHIYGNKFNKMYTSDGVYCTEDEVDVATQIFNKEQFTDIISVCSPAQLLRKALMYIDHGIIPQMVSVPPENPQDLWHDYVAEATNLIPALICDDRTQQREERQHRKPHSEPRDISAEG